ncbi:MAG: metallophosphoesterase [Sedimentisphaerales bacterium]
MRKRDTITPSKRGWRWKLHFENFPFLVHSFSFLLSISFTKARGIRNAMDVKLSKVSFALSNLPVGFDNTRILLVTDLHIDGMDGLTEEIMATLDDVDYDFCILGGDYSFRLNDDRSLVCTRMKTVAQFLVSKSKVFGVLGNHDKYKIGQLLSECGVEMLLNENVCIEKGSDRLYGRCPRDSWRLSGHSISS